MAINENKRRRRAADKPPTPETITLKCDCGISHIVVIQPQMSLAIIPCRNCGRLLRWYPGMRLLTAEVAD